MDLAIIAGFLFKTDDEMEDIDFIKSPLLKEYIQCMSIAVFSILFLDNIYISWFLALCVIPISYYLNQVDTPFWKSLVPLPYIALLLHIHSIHSIPSFISLLSTAISFITCAFICVLEALIFPEEHSLVKLGTRISLVFIFTSMIYFSNPLPSTINILCLCIGYCLASSMIKLFVMNPSDIIPLEEYEVYKESNIDDIIAKEIPIINELIGRANNMNKDVLSRIMTCIVIIFHKFLNNK